MSHIRNHVLPCCHTAYYQNGKTIDTIAPLYQYLISHIHQLFIPEMTLQRDTFKFQVSAASQTTCYHTTYYPNWHDLPDRDLKLIILKKKKKLYLFLNYLKESLFNSATLLSHTPLSYWKKVKLIFYSFQKDLRYFRELLFISRPWLHPNPMHFIQCK